MRELSPKVSVLALLLAAFVTACAPHRITTPAPAGTARVVGYYFGPTVSRGFHVSTVDGNLLTHINYAFGEVLSDGSVALANPPIDSANFAEIRQLKQRYPHLQVLVSFGGWGGSKFFSDAVATAESRAHFAQSILDVFFTPFPDVFDGVDLDWEYPVRGGPAGIINRPEDRENLTAFVAEMRRALDSQASDSKHYLITMAVPAGAGHLVKYEMPKLGQMLDFVNLMTYDFHSASGPVAHFNSPLGSASDDPTPWYNIKTSVEAFLNGGVPRERLLVGVPFYGYGMATVPATANGRFQAVTRDTSSSGVRPKWTGSVRFYDIRKIRKDGFKRHWDSSAAVPWLYNSTTKTFISYDDRESLERKSEFVRVNQLGGIMIWELSGDDGTLLPAINRELRR